MSLPETEYLLIKYKLDYLHKQKILISNRILFLNVNDYIGESTTSELMFARYMEKTILWLTKSRYQLTDESVYICSKIYGLNQGES